ncbi:MAG: hypothetical protein ACYTDY_00460 [Planctomycetota bacterium]
MRIHARLYVTLLLVPLLMIAAGCSSTEKVNGEEVYSPDDPEVAEGPEFKQSKFKVYNVYKPQVQRHDFNGVFQFFPDKALVVRSFWNRKFVELTRENYYDEFFLEFYDYMAGFAQTYPADSRRKEKMLDTLERSFHNFCAAKDVEDEFVKFQKRQASILEN